MSDDAKAVVGDGSLLIGSKSGLVVLRVPDVRPTLTPFNARQAAALLLNEAAKLESEGAMKLHEVVLVELAARHTAVARHFAEEAAAAASDAAEHIRDEMRKDGPLAPQASAVLGLASAARHASNAAIHADQCAKLAARRASHIGLSMAPPEAE